MGSGNTGTMALDASTMADSRETPRVTPCPLCRGYDHELVSRRGRDGKPLDSVLCRGCGHVFNVPIPTEADLRTYYHQAYRSAYKGIIRPRPKHVLRAGIRALERMSQLRSLAAPQARLLDIGAGGGEFVYMAAKAGFAARGIEPHQGYAEHARAMLDIDVIHGAMQDVQIADESIDVATMHHVLEHLPDPVDALRRLWRWLTPGGLLVIEVPDIASWYHAPRRRFHAAHVHNFNASGLEDAARHAGFAIIASTLTQNTGHLNLMARRGIAPALPTWRNAAASVAEALRAHSSVAHALSGRPLRRMWANLKRPVVETARLAMMGARSPKAILDTLWSETTP